MNETFRIFQDKDFSKSCKIVETFGQHLAKVLRDCGHQLIPEIVIVNRTITFNFTENSKTPSIENWDSIEKLNDLLTTSGFSNLNKKYLIFVATLHLGTYLALPNNEIIGPTLAFNPPICFVRKGNRLFLIEEIENKWRMDSIWNYSGRTRINEHILFEECKSIPFPTLKTLCFSVIAESRQRIPWKGVREEFEEIQKKRETVDNYIAQKKKMICDCCHMD